MAGMKSLAKDTALYGMSSILGRLLNWLLVPLYVVKVNNTEFGEVTQLYAWTALLLVFLTYGLETGFFRFSNSEDQNESRVVFTTCMTSLWATTSLFLGIIFLFLNPISSWLGFASSPEYIGIMATIIGIDVMSSLPFAQLRLEKRPLRFASIKLLFVFLNIGLNLFFLVLCPDIYESNSSWLSYVYSPDRSGVFYILLSNLIASSVMMLALFKQIFCVKYRLDKELYGKIIRYSMPLLVSGVAGIINQTADKILFPMLTADQATAKADLGIYGANFKFAVVMIMFIQAFRFAYEPFVFAGDRSLKNTSAYVKAMKYFVILGLFIFLSVGLFIQFLPVIPIAKDHIDPAYFSGLAVVPIVMLAEFFFGVFFNLSFWYKLTDRTHWGAIFSTMGCVLTIGLNVIFVPIYGYMACAWTAFTVYLIMMLASYYIGKKTMPIKYEVSNGLSYFALALVLYGVGSYIPLENLWTKFIVSSALVVVYMVVVGLRDFRQILRR